MYITLFSFLPYHRPTQCTPRPALAMCPPVCHTGCAASHYEKEEHFNATFKHTYKCVTRQSTWGSWLLSFIPDLGALWPCCSGTKITIINQSWFLTGPQSKRCQWSSTSLVHTVHLVFLPQTSYFNLQEHGETCFMRHYVFCILSHLWHNSLCMFWSISYYSYEHIS